jgi:hypothetical protein
MKRSSSFRSVKQVFVLLLLGDWANEKQVVSVELLRYKLHREFFALRSMPTFLARP